jgi:hypothetical protein
VQRDWSRGSSSPLSPFFEPNNALIFRVQLFPTIIYFEKNFII